ncbi:MAG: DUF11 domain-containing protein, partial [Dehalococcoidia bacterium]|nr:DUF11 domain-containing protein [Dehalococcoidia bacterium]
VPGPTGQEWRYRSQVNRYTSTGASIDNSYTLSDDFYANRLPKWWPVGDEYIYPPDLAIGRLIETPGDIVNTINVFLDRNGVTDMSSSGRAFVSGTSVLVDAANSISNTFAADGITKDLLIGGSWNEAQEKASLLDNRSEIASLNQYSTHYTARTPANSTGPGEGQVSSADVLSATAVLSGVIVSSIGSHFGLSIADEDGNPDSTLDMAQAFARKGALLVGNTGYGWAVVDSVGLSENLINRFTSELVKGSVSPVGKALANAKQDYYASAYMGSFDYYDLKILSELTLYGLPMYEVRTPGGLLAPKAGNIKSPATGPYRVLGDLQMSSRVFTPTNVLSSTTGGGFYTVNGEFQSSNLRPNVPCYSSDIGLSGLTARGAIFTGGTYTDIADFDPVIGQVVTETSYVAQGYSDTSWYPSALQSVNATGSVQKLVAMTGQYRSIGSPTTGQMRLYDRLAYDIYYTASISDTNPPVVILVENPAARRAIGFSVRATDETGVQRLVVAYTRGDGRFDSVDLVYNAGSGRWEGQAPVTGTISYIVQAADVEGNVSVYTNWGNYYTASSAPYPDLSPSVLSQRPSTVFSGDAITWTVVLTNVGNLGSIVVLTDVLPTNVTYVGSSASVGVPGYNAPGRRLTWNGVVGVGSTVTITIGANVNSGLLSGTITNTVTIDDGLLQSRTQTAAITPRRAFLPVVTKVYAAGW